MQWSDGTVTTLPETKLKTPHLWRSGEAGGFHPNLTAEICSSRHFIMEPGGGVSSLSYKGTFRSQKSKKLRGMGHFWTFRCRFAWQVEGIVHLVKSEQKKTLGFCSSFHLQPPLHYTNDSYNYNYNYHYHYITLQSTPLHFTTLHYTNDSYNYNYNYTTLHYTTPY